MGWMEVKEKEQQCEKRKHSTLVKKSYFSLRKRSTTAGDVTKSTHNSYINWYVKVWVTDKYKLVTDTCSLLEFHFLEYSGINDIGESSLTIQRSRTRILHLLESCKIRLSTNCKIHDFHLECIKRKLTWNPSSWRPPLISGFDKESKISKIMRKQLGN